MKRLAAWLMLCVLLGMSAWAEEIAPVLIDRTGELTEEYRFPDGTQVLEIVFPRVYSSDCAIVRFGYDVMLIDASDDTPLMQRRVRSALNAMGVDYIDIAFNSHPHHDHLNGFGEVVKSCPIGRLVLTFPEDYNRKSVRASQDFAARGIPIEHAADGDVLTMGPHDEVTMRVIQRNDTGKWKANDRSAMLLIQYGERTILFTGDVENRAQRSYFTNPPEGGLKADILKYPHHGQVKLANEFLEMIDPELAFMNGASGVMDGAKSYLTKHKVPYLIGYNGLTRMRTDGQIWVVDYLHEVETDRSTINPSYTSTTDTP